MRTPIRATFSRMAGWIADRRIPPPLRAPIYRSYARFTGADLGEVRDPLVAHASLGEFFVRRLKEGVRPIAADPTTLASPCDGTLQAADRIDRGRLVQAKGRSYSLGVLLGSESDSHACEGGYAWTIYLSPRDYHRVHAPDACTLAGVRRIPGGRFSVAPQVLARRLVLPVNERAVFRLETEHGPLWMVMVGATNVGRIRVVGEPAPGPGPQPPSDPDARRFARGEEMARFEMGSTVILVAPRGAGVPSAGLFPGARMRLGQPIGARNGVGAPVRA